MMTYSTNHVEQADLIEKELMYLAELGRMSANLLHDLSAPLSAAVITLEELSLSENSPLALRAKKDLLRLERYISTARQQLLAKPARRNFNIKPVLDNAAKLMRPKAITKNVKLEVIASPDLKLFGQPLLLERVIANLISNGVDAYSNIVETASSVVKVRARASGNYILITVEDKGQGILFEERQLIFRPFYTTKKREGGLGIGLVSAKLIVEQEFKGTISVGVNHGQGTIFSLHILCHNISQPSAG